MSESISPQHAEQAWVRTQAELVLHLDAQQYDAIVSKCTFFAFEDGILIIHVPNLVAQSYLRDKYSSLIKQYLAKFLNQFVQVQYVVVSAPEQSAADAPATPLEIMVAAEQDHAEPVPEQPLLIPRSNLNEQYNFNNFVVGYHNQLAHAAAQSLAHHANSPYTPLFIYSHVGLGKTHLLHAIGHEARNQGARVFYSTTEKFTNDLIASIRTQKMDAFRQRYRLLDLLLLDDVQFLAGKERTQEEFFYTFTDLFEQGKRVALTSDSPPHQIRNLEARLRSRFEGGLPVDIDRPEYETRLAILQTKVQLFNYDIPMSLLVPIAECVTDNIRELEGALHHLNLVQAQRGERLTEQEVADMMSLNPPTHTLPTPDMLLTLVARYFGLDAHTLRGSSRKKQIVHARQVTMYLLRHEVQISLPKIGELLGGRDHSTVRHGVDRISSELRLDMDLAREVSDIRRQLYNTTNVTLPVGSMPPDRMRVQEADRTDTSPVARETATD